VSVYVLDSNVISDMLLPRPIAAVLQQLTEHRQDTLCLCAPIEYEARRGNYKVNATAKLRNFEQLIKPQL